MVKFREISERKVKKSDSLLNLGSVLHPVAYALHLHDVIVFEIYIFSVFLHTHSINRQKREKDEFGHESIALFSYYAKHHLYAVRYGSKK